MFKLKLSILFPFIFSIVFSSCLRSENKAKRDQPKIKIGVFAPMSGKDSTFGQSTLKGLQLAIEQINDKGGFQGRGFELVVKDDQGKDELVAPAVSDLIEKQKVSVLVGEVISHLSLIAGPIAQNAKIPMITHASTNPKVTEVGNYVFRICYVDDFQGTAMARFAYEELKLKRVAVLKDASSDWGKSLALHFIESFKKLGGSILADESYKRGDIDFKDQLTFIRKLKPDAIFIPGYYTDAAKIARQTRQLGIEATLLGGDGWDSPKLFESAREAVNGSYFTNHFSAESLDERVQTFVKAFRDKYTEVPDAIAATAYDAGKMIYKAVEMAQSSKPEAIQQALLKIKEFPGVTGDITMNKDRNAIKPLVIVKVDGLSNRYVTTIEPKALD